MGETKKIPIGCTVTGKTHSKLRKLRLESGVPTSHIVRTGLAILKEKGVNAAKDPNPGMKRSRMTVLFTQEQADFLNAFSKETGVSKASLVRKSFTAYLELHEKQLKKIK